MNSFDSQPIVDEAGRKILDIMKTRVLTPVGKNASQGDVWNDAIDEIREQLEVIRPIADMAREIPHYAIAADIQLDGWVHSNGWPKWSAIVNLDVSANPQHPWLAVGRQVPTQNNAPSPEDISIDEVPIVATKGIHGEKGHVDRKGKGKQREVVTEDENQDLDQLEETQMEVDESSPPPPKPLPKKAPKRGRSRAPAREVDESSLPPPKPFPKKAPKRGRSQAPSRAPSEMPEEDQLAADEDAQPGSEGGCSTCSQRGAQCIRRPGKACFQCNSRKVKCSLAPLRARSATGSQPPPPSTSKPAPPAPSTQSTEDAKSAKVSKDSDNSKPRSKSRGRRNRSRHSSPDILSAPIKLKIPQSKKRVRESSPSVERQSRKAKTSFDAVVITKPPPGATSKSSNVSVKAPPKTLEERMAAMEEAMLSFGKKLDDLAARGGTGDRETLEPKSADASSRPSAEGSGLSLPPSSSVPTTSLDPSPHSSAPSHPASLPPSGRIPTTTLNPAPITSAPPHQPSALLATTSADGPSPPTGGPISPLEDAGSVPAIVVSLPEVGTSASDSTTAETAPAWNTGFTFGTYRARPPLDLTAYFKQTSKKSTDADMEE